MRCFIERLYIDDISDMRLLIKALNYYLMRINSDTRLLVTISLEEINQFGEENEEEKK
jgi:hypothetical protein